MIDDKLLYNMNNIFKSHKEIEKIILFGSRAENREEYNSDIDLSVVGDFDFLFCERLKEELSELETLLKFDVINHNDINNNELKNNIEKYGKIIYNKIG